MTLVSPRHYMPVLRWKRGERVALRELGAERSRVIPLIEPLTPSYDIAWANEFLAQVATNWGQSAFFLDLGALGDDAGSLLRNLMRVAVSMSVAPILVTRLAADLQSQDLVKLIGVNSDQGVCIRITKADLRSAVLEPRIELTLDLLGRRARDLDIVVDYGVCRASDPPLSYIEERLPRFESWRSLIVLGGSFPKDLGGLSVGEHELIRQEWLNWSKQIAVMSSRIPTFGDYTTQHAFYEDPPQNANVSASIRYTSSEYWVVMRGEGLRNKTGAGFAQYPAIAQLLMGRKEYRGPSFSYGDRYISQVATRDLATTGNPETWLRAGINHHIVFAVQQISELLPGSVVS